VSPGIESIGRGLPSRLIKQLNFHSSDSQSEIQISQFDLDAFQSLIGGRRMGLKAQIPRAITVLQRAQELLSPRLLEQAVGLCVLSTLRGAFIFSASLGRGLVVKRLSKYRWGFPSAVLACGMGFGAQAGGEVVDVVVVFTDSTVLAAFESGLQLRLGGELGAALGHGIDGQVFATVGSRGAAGVFAFSVSHGAFVGVSLEGSILTHNKLENRVFYGRSHPIRSILNAEFELEGLAINLVQILHQFLFEISEKHAAYLSGKLMPLNRKEFELVKVQDDIFKRKQATLFSQSGSNAAARGRRGSDATILSEFEEGEDETEAARLFEVMTGSKPPLKDVTVVLDHVVDETNEMVRRHGIVSVRKGQRLNLLKGDLENGLGHPYEDYVLVEEKDGQRREGKVSKFCVK